MNHEPENPNPSLRQADPIGENSSIWPTRWKYQMIFFLTGVILVRKTEPHRGLTTKHKSRRFAAETFVHGNLNSMVGGSSYGNS